MLSDTERHQYLETNTIPSFKNLVNQNLYSTLFDINGRVITSTRKNALESGFNSQEEMIGLSYAEVTQDIIMNLMKDIPAENINEILVSCQKIHELLLIAVAQKKVVNFIDLIPYNQHYRSFLETYIPIFHPSGEVIAIQSMSIEFKMFDLASMLINKPEKAKSFAIPDEAPPLHLPPRQHEILYLLLQGIPQEYAAQILNIKRGTLARIVSENLCPKFGIQGSNTKLLIEKAMKLGFQNHMPKSLWKPGIIILDDEIADFVNQKATL